MRTYDTLSQAMSDLFRRGYVLNFNIRTDRLACAEHSLELHPEEFDIDEYYRFEGETDPGDSDIIYAISSKKYALKGVLVNAYGVYAETLSADLIKKLG